MKFCTTRFGDLEIGDDKIIHFNTGLVGLPDMKRYTLIDHKDSPLKWLHAVDDPDIAFIVVSPDLIVADYSLELDKAVRQHIGLENDDDMAILVTMRVDGEDVIANFQGPIVINTKNREGVQVVLENSEKTYHEVV